MFCFPCFIRSSGSRLACLEDIDTGVLDLRGVLGFREVPLVCGFWEGRNREAELDSRGWGWGFAAGFALEVTVTTLVVIFGVAFFAFKAASDRGRLCGCNGAMI